jgi:hypothetical protein
MRRLSYFAVVAVLSAGPAIPGGLRPACGEEMQFVSVTEFASMSTQMEQFETRLASLEKAGYSADDGCKSCGPTPGLTADFELLFLRGYNTDDDEDSDSDTTKFKEAARISLGWTTASGLGIRARWFDYDLNTTDEDFSVQTLDLELHDYFALGRRWAAEVAGGVRYAEIKETEEGNSLNPGVGPMASVRLNRCLTDNSSLYILGRESLLFGASGENDDAATFVTELQMGYEYRRPILCSSVLVVRAGVESQWWSGMWFEDAETFGLIGAMGSVGIVR